MVKDGGEFLLKVSSNNNVRKVKVGSNEARNGISHRAMLPSFTNKCLSRTLKTLLFLFFSAKPMHNYNSSAQEERNHPVQTLLGILMIGMVLNRRSMWPVDVLDVVVDY